MNKKTNLISGGTNGIGKAMVIRLLKDGHNVVTFSRDKHRCDQLKKLLGKLHSQKQFLVLTADVTNEASLKSVVSKVVKKFGAIDILINNAGVGYFRDCDKVDIARFQKMIQINVVGMVLLTKLVVPHMKKKKIGLIINLSSISGKIAFANGEFYSATKFGVMGYSEGIRKELKSFGIKVATLCPGMIKTSFFSKKELERRSKRMWNGKIPQMLDVKDISNIISLICNQSEHCDIQDLTVMPF